MHFPTLPDLYEVDGVLFNSGEDNGLYVLSARGWEGQPRKRVAETERTSDDGSYFGPQTYSPRVIELDVLAVAHDRDARDANMEAVSNLCADNGQLGRYVARKISASGRERQTDVLLLDQDAPETINPLAFKTRLVLVASDPRMYDSVLSTSDTVTLPTPAIGGIDWTSGMSWTTGVTWQTSAGSPGLLYLTNSGRISTPVSLLITAGSVVDGVGVQHLGTGQSVILSDSLAPADTVMIDTRMSSVTRNGQPVTALTASQYFDLAPGLNVVRFFSNVPGQTATVFAQWRDAYRGG